MFHFGKLNGLENYLRRIGTFAVASLMLLGTRLLIQPAEAGFAGGAGRPDTPYLIATAEQLTSIGSDPNLLDKHFVLVEDIDLDPKHPAGSVFTRALIAPDTGPPEYGGTPFVGGFDGNEHCIRNLTLTNGVGRHLGLIGVVGSGGVVRRLRIENATVTGGQSSRYIGALAGINRGTIEDCCSTGFVSGEKDPGNLMQRPAQFRTRLDNPEFAGGLVGDNRGAVLNCYAVGTVVGGWRCVSAGGLVAMSGGNISNCYAEGTVVDGSGSAVGIGGLVGGNGGTVVHSYATASVIGGTRTDHVGGLVGRGTGVVTQCFWDIEASGASDSAGGTGLTTAQMMETKTYSRNGWAGNRNWVMDAGRDYPRLDWEATVGRGIPQTALDWLDGSGTEYDPYVVSTHEQLAMIGRTSLIWDRHFVLGNDIDLDPSLPGRQVFTASVMAPDPSPSQSVSPKLPGPGFTGTFDGKGYILYNLTVDNTVKPTSYVGLFGVVGVGGRVANLHLQEANMTGITAKHNGAIGALAGCNRGSITYCSVTGLVTGDDRIGGLVGRNEGSVTGCRAVAEVTGDQASGVGGLVGCNLGDIADCYARGSVTGRGRCGGLGGLLGNNYRDTRDGVDGRVARCYATGRVVGGKGSFDLGGLVGRSYGQVVKSLWDMQASGIRVSGGGMGLTTAQMTDPNVYSLNGWAENPNWILTAENDYPRFAWEVSSGKIIPERAITWLRGSGTRQDPYVIATARQLALIGTASILWDKCFVLAADLDLDGIDIRPIGAPDAFTGSFDGNDHVIRNVAMDANGAPIHYLGLFGTIGSGGRVTSLRLENVSITAGIGSLCCGGLAGKNDGTITSCSTTGVVTGDDSLGGLVGANAGTISTSYTTCKLDGTRNSRNVGGLAGYNVGNVTDCYATGDVTCADISYSLGGLVGGNEGTIARCYATGNAAAGAESHGLGGLTGENEGTIANCYASGNVTAGEKSFPLAGLVGSNGGTIRHCYSVGRVGANRVARGLVGTISGGSAKSPAALSSVVASSIVGSFWDIETSGQRRSTGGAGKTTAEMQTVSTFLDAKWDFVNETRNGTDDIWWIREGHGYPRLTWELIKDNPAALSERQQEHAFSSLWWVFLCGLVFDSLQSCP